MKVKKLDSLIKEYIWGFEDWQLCDDSKVLADSELGSNADAFDSFAQLIKIIDAKNDLSVQVHPDDEYAKSHENSYGKTEMWYIIDACEDSGIYLGFKNSVTRNEVETAISQNTLTDLLNFYPVKKGECYFVPAGTVHAIGKGCKICEIQQNSNITYRVYDYDRRDKEGNPRPLHIKKALDVINYDKFEPLLLRDDIIALSKYFCVKKHTVCGSKKIPCDKASFKYITCVDGQGSINSKYPLTRGTSYFVPACDGTLEIKGDLTLLTSEVRKLYIGIDLGGTFIKGGIVDDLGNILVSDKVETQAAGGKEQVVENVLTLSLKLCRSLGITFADVSGIGMAIPGTVDSKTGTVLYSNNLGWSDFEIASTLAQKTNLPIRIANDANVAALGESLFGSGNEYKTTVMLTLGTGVGGGIVIDGKLYEGNRSAGAEMGHSVIVAGGEKCTCGRRGCLEAYASATALIRDTKRAMQNDTQSLMWQVGIENVDGSTAFKYSDLDKTAKSVVDNYIKMLGCGIVNIANELRPEAIILGGGICNEGDALIKPLRKILDDEIFGGNRGPRVKVVTATLGNKAGILGAASLIKGL